MRQAAEPKKYVDDCGEEDEIVERHWHNAEG